jgi:concentrative nucleoside transporter, CNT family
VAESHEPVRYEVTFVIYTNFGSVGIMVGGMTAMCPERRADIVRLGLPSLVSASIACCMTGAVVGMLTGQ